jgi:carbon monoxide dehydrogenase subunit G
MKIEECFEVDVPIKEMFDQINDIEQIGYCIAGVKQVTVMTPDESKWKLEARAGFMARTINLTGRVVERRVPDYLAFTGQGQDVELTGHLLLTALGPHRTRCETVIDANVVGPLAPLVDLMAKGPQQALIRQTIANLRARLEAAPTAPVASHPVPDVDELRRPMGGFARLWAWLRSRWHRHS